MSFLQLLVPLLLAVVVGVLAAGLISMARGGDSGRKWSNRLMQARVLAQFAAIVVIALILLLTTR